MEGGGGHSGNEQVGEKLSFQCNCEILMAIFSSSSITKIIHDFGQFIQLAKGKYFLL